MIATIDRQYAFSAGEVRDILLLHLAAKDVPVPREFSEAIISWDVSKIVYITFTEKMDAS